MLIALNQIIIDEPLVCDSVLPDYKINNAEKIKLTKLLGKLGYGFDSYTSFAITDKARDDKPANYALIPNQYFLYACKMYDFSMELYKYFILF